MGKLIVWMWHEAMYSAEKTGCYGADGVGKAEVMSEADVKRTIESFNVPGLQRNHGNGEGDWRVVKGEQYGWVGLGTVGRGLSRGLENGIFNG